MASTEHSEEPSEPTIRLHHGTDEDSANDLLLHGVDSVQAALWNGSGEFWTTTDHERAEWFARSHPNSPPAACFEFTLPAAVLRQILQMQPPGAIFHAPGDYEFLPDSYDVLNQYMTNQQVVPVA
jgi:hypothetical protein